MAHRQWGSPCWSLVLQQERWLPKAGRVDVIVRVFFWRKLWLAVSIYMISPIIPSVIHMGLWLLCSIVLAII